MALFSLKSHFKKGWCKERSDKVNGLYPARFFTQSWPIQASQPAGEVWSSSRITADLQTTMDSYPGGTIKSRRNWSPRVARESEYCKTSISSVVYHKSAMVYLRNIMVYHTDKGKLIHSSLVNKLRLRPVGGLRERWDCSWLASSYGCSDLIFLFNTEKTYNFEKFLRLNYTSRIFKINFWILVGESGHTGRGVDGGANLLWMWSQDVGSHPHWASSPLQTPKAPPWNLQEFPKPLWAPNALGPISAIPHGFCTRGSSFPQHSLLESKGIPLFSPREKGGVI